MELFVVKKGSTDADSAQPRVSYTIEPSLFPVTGRLQPIYGNEGWQSAYRRHLERKIQRNPRDLLAHTRRILLNYEARDEKACYGALIDLFLILGSRGLAIRENLLGREGE